MAYRTIKKIRILRNERWIDVDKDYLLTKQEVDECPNLQAWIRWDYIEEVVDSKEVKKK